MRKPSPGHSSPDPLLYSLHDVVAAGGDMRISTCHPFFSCSFGIYLILLERRGQQPKTLLA